MTPQKQPDLPSGENKLADLSEFVITVIEYVRTKDWLTGKEVIVPVRRVIRG